MTQIPADRKYTEGHLWFLPDEKTAAQNLKTEETGIVGLTDYAQSRLGDLIAVEMPRAGANFAAHDVVAYLEGILQTSELEAFANMEVIEGNPRLEIHPDLVNREPYGEGWVLRVRLKGMPRWLEAPDYADYLEKGVIVEGA